MRSPLYKELQDSCMCEFSGSQFQAHACGRVFRSRGLRVFMSVSVKLTRRHPLVCGRLFFGVGLFPLEVVVSSLAVATRPERLLEAAIACDRKRKGD